MPIWLRNFTFKKIQEFYDKEQEQLDAKNNQLTNQNAHKQLARPDIPQANIYNTKVPTKQ